MSSFVSALGGQDKETLDAYLAHLGFVGDEMAAGLGGLFVNSFPEVPSLDEIEVGFTFSKNDVLQLAAHLDNNCHVMEVLPLPRVDQSPTSFPAITSVTVFRRITPCR
jgi:hypothetical protein